jgi:hypothetical protein
MQSESLKSINNPSWILALLPQRLPGEVKRVFQINNGQGVLIAPLVHVPLADGTWVQQFFAVENTSRINQGDYLSFEWQEPGQRSYNQKKEKYDDPKAISLDSISQGEAEFLAEDIRNILASGLRSQLEQQEKELQSKLQEVNNLVEQKVKIRSEELDRNAQKLEQKEAEIQAVEENLLAKFEEKEAQLALDIQKQEQILERRKKELQSFSESAKVLREEAEKVQQDIERYRLAIPQKIKTSAKPDLGNPNIPEALAEKWQTALANNGLILPKALAISYLVSLISAFYSGSLVLLNGPVGVGKTSVVKASAKLLGGHSKVIPVRPAWLDPTDLLGFFDPIKEVFRPTPFLTALKEARDFPNNLCLICLDELNLARIENYGSDLLSALEYSRSTNTAKEGLKEKQGLLLYSEDIETDLWQEALFLNEKPEKSDKEQLRLQQLQSLLNDFQSNFHLPSNTAILGTLNSDETTYDLSPKVIDRAYVVSYSAADLALPLASEVFSKNSEVLEPLNLSVSTLVDKIDQLLSLSFKPENANQPEIKDVTEGLNLGWERVLQWNKLFSELGIPLGHRASRDFRVMYAVCYLLGLSPQDCLGYFLFIKLLPRISFFKDSNKQELFDQLLNALDKDLKAFGTDLESYDPGDVLTQLQAQVDDSRRQHVRYWVRT